MIEDNVLKPYVNDFGNIGSAPLGYITAIQGLPFEIKRVYWTYYSPHDVVRGHHSHKSLHQLIFAVSGIIEFNLESKSGQTYSFTLSKPSMGLYIPPNYWRTIKFSHNAVLLCLASEPYTEDDYIRDYNSFKLS